MTILRHFLAIVLLALFVACFELCAFALLRPAEWLYRIAARLSRP